MEEQKPEKPKKYVFLYILGSLSFAANLTLVIINILLLTASPVINWILKYPVVDTITEEEQHGNYVYFLIKIALHAFCIYAVVLILRMKRRGFFYYLSIQLILLLIPFIFLTSLGFTYILINACVSSIFSVLFIMLYSLYIPSMSKNKNPRDISQGLSE